MLFIRPRSKPVELTTAHAKPEHLKNLHSLLTELRKLSALKEKTLGCFYRKSKSVLHFHIKATRLYAHVYDGKIWHEVDIEQTLSVTKQKQLSKAILTILQIELT